MLKYILISFLIITNVYAYTCEEMGYTKTIVDCPEGGLKCPAEPEKIFCCDPCGDGRGYKYNLTNCSPDDGLQVAGTECGGRWTECRQCASEYKYNKDNCRAPKILAGLQCANSYTGCVYPVGSGCIPTAGYIYYADGSCHADYDDTKEPIGIIVDAARKTIIALDETDTTWNGGGVYETIPNLPNYSNVADALLDMDGQANTDKIVAFSAQSEQDYKAALYCANKTTGNRKWYLPAAGQLVVISTVLSNVENGLAEVPTSTKFKTNKYYYTSTSHPNTSYGAWGFISNGDRIIYLDRKSTRPTRCFSSF